MVINIPIDYKKSQFVCKCCGKYLDKLVVVREHTDNEFAVCKDCIVKMYLVVLG